MSDDYDPPNELSMNNSKRFVEMCGYDFLPSRVSHSVEGGIMVSFYQSIRRAAIEFDNDGDISAIISDGISYPTSWAVEEEMVDTLNMIRHYIRGEEIPIQSHPAAGGEFTDLIALGAKLNEQGELDSSSVDNIQHNNNVVRVDAYWRAKDREKYKALEEERQEKFDASL